MQNPFNYINQFRPTTEIAGFEYRKESQMHESGCIGKEHFRFSPVFVKKGQWNYVLSPWRAFLTFRFQNKILFAFLHTASFLYHLQDYQISRWPQEMKFRLNTTVSSVPPKIHVTMQGKMKQHDTELQYVQNNNIFQYSHDIVLRYIPDKGHY